MKRIGDVAMDRITTIRRAAALQRLSLLADFCQVLLSLTKPEGERGEVEQRGQGLSAAAWRARIGKGSEDLVPSERRTGQEPSPRGHPTQPVNRLSPYPNCQDASQRTFARP